MTLLEDSTIIDLFFERSEQAIGELERKYGAAVRRTAGNILSDRLDVEECANDTWLGTWNSIPPCRPEHLGSFVCRIARNQAVSRLRSETAKKRNAGFEPVLEEIGEFIPSGEDPEKDVEARELLDAVNRFLASLDYDDRFLFLRRYWYADGVREIAAMAHMSENRVSVRLFRLREKLKKKLKKEGLLA